MLHDPRRHRRGSKCRYCDYRYDNENEYHHGRRNCEDCPRFIVGRLRRRLHHRNGTGRSRHPSFHHRQALLDCSNADCSSTCCALFLTIGLVALYYVLSLIVKWVVTATKDRENVSMFVVKNIYWKTVETLTTARPFVKDSRRQCLTLTVKREKNIHRHRAFRMYNREGLDRRNESSFLVQMFSFTVQ
jgi:hypothetical protein